MTLDDRLKDINTYSDEYLELNEAKQAILSDLLEIIKDVPLEQPFDEDMDNITLQGHLIFRKGVNWQNERLREKVKRYCE